MARIPRGFIDRLLAQTSLVDLISASVALKQRGENYTGLCPFHNEKTPSFSINARKGFYYCFGCGASGNAISFLMAHGHLDFMDAVKELARMHGVPLPRSSNNTHNNTYQKGLDILTDAMNVYCDALSSHTSEAQAARAYLHKRGLNDTIIAQFSLGFVPDNWDTLKQRHAKHLPILRDTGLLIVNENNRSYDRFRHRIIFPIRTTRGQTVGFGGRVRRGRLRSGGVWSRVRAASCER